MKAKLITFLLFSISIYGSSFYHLKMSVSKNGQEVSSPEVLIQDGKKAELSSVEINGKKETHLSILPTSDKSLNGDGLKLDIDMTMVENGKKNKLNPEILLFVDEEVEYESVSSQTGETINIKVFATKKTL